MVRRKVQAAFRHKIYMVMVGFKEDELKNRGKRAIQKQGQSEEEKEILYAKFDVITKQKPEFLKRALELFEIKVSDELMEKGKTCQHCLQHMMEECYLDYQTKSMQPDMMGSFNKRVEVDLKHHNQLIEKILKGTSMPELEKDPLLEKEADYNVDLTKFKGYQLESQGTFLNPSKDKVEVSDGAMRQISDFQKRFRANRERKKSQAEEVERKASMEERRLSFEESKEVIGMKSESQLDPVKEESEQPPSPQKNERIDDEPKSKPAEPEIKQPEPVIEEKKPEPAPVPEKVEEKKVEESKPVVQPEPIIPDISGMK